MPVSNTIVWLGSLSSFNCGVKNFLFVIDVRVKHAWVKPLKDKKQEALLQGFLKIVNKSKRKPNQLWVDQGREFYNSPT